MLALGHVAIRWILAVSLTCMLFAWPLHQASHTGDLAGVSSQSIESYALKHVGTDLDGIQHEEDSCLWCLLYVGPLPQEANYTAFCTHAEASSPPSQIPAGIPPSFCTLAANPRGPPAS